MNDEMLHERLRDDPRMPRVGFLVADRYKVLKVLGEGGFAVTYRVSDTKLGGELALKVLDPDKGAKKSFVERFKQEITLTRQLQHHNTIKIWDAGITDNDCLFFAMELVPGEELGVLLQRTNGISPERVVRITAQILGSLAEAHKLGIIHRDLKPSNIMVSQPVGHEDFVKVLDFGIAKALSSDLSMVKTQSGQINCTPQYASPEILRGEGIQASSDLYALGLTMIQMLTGQPPVQGRSLGDIIAMQISPQPIPVPPFLKGTMLGDVIERAIAKSVDDRYVSALQMLDDLRGAGDQARTPISCESTPAAGFSDEIAKRLTKDINASIPTIAAQSLPAKEVRWRDPILRIAIACFLVATIAFVVFKVQFGGDSDETGEPLATGANESLAATGELLETTPEVAERTLGVQATADTVREEQPTADVHANGGQTSDSEEPQAAVLQEERQTASVDEVDEQTDDQEEPEPTETEEQTPSPSMSVASTPNQHNTHVLIRSEPPGAVVWRGDEELGETPWEGVLESTEDTVQLTIRASGHERQRIRVDMTEEEAEFDVELERRRRDPEPEREQPMQREPETEPTNTSPFGGARTY